MVSSLRKKMSHNRQFPCSRGGSERFDGRRPQAPGQSAAGWSVGLSARACAARRIDCSPAYRGSPRAETVRRRVARNLLQIAHAPGRVLRAQLPVKGLVARRCVHGPAAKGPVEEKYGAGLENRGCPTNQRHACVPGRDVDHVERDDRCGGGDRPGLLTHIEAQRRQHIGGSFRRDPRAIDCRRSGSRSLGCQVRCGVSFAKWTTCCPVPLPISSTKPRSGSACFSTSAIGPLLRSADGLTRRPSSRRLSVSHRIGGSHPVAASPLRKMSKYALTRLSLRGI